MFIPGCSCVISCPDVSIMRIYNVNKSCQVIVGNLLEQGPAAIGKSAILADRQFSEDEEIR